MLACHPSFMKVFNLRVSRYTASCISFSLSQNEVLLEKFINTSRPVHLRNSY